MLQLPAGYNVQTLKNALKMKGILLHILLSDKVNLYLESGLSQVHLLGFLTLALGMFI